MDDWCLFRKNRLHAKEGILEHLPPTQYELAGDTLMEAVANLLVPAPSVKLVQFPNFSTITGGFRPNEFTILCGATGTGKTTLLANWSDALISQEIPHFVASVETGRHDFVRRIISARIGKDWNTGDAIPLEEVRRTLNPPELERIKNSKLYLSLYENRFSIEQLIHDIEYMVETHGVKVCFIDNLNFFMEVTSAQQSVVEMDRVIHEMIIFCKRCPVHVVMVMHPKKTMDGRVESEFDIKGSSTSVQESQNVLLFNRPKQEFIDQGLADYGDRELTIAKMRRRGSAVGTRMILSGIDGVKYLEGAMICRHKNKSDTPVPSTGSAQKLSQPIYRGVSNGSMSSTKARGLKYQKDSSEE
jgi:replicative DNA helicase